MKAIRRTTTTTVVTIRSTRTKRGTIAIAIAIATFRTTTTAIEPGLDHSTTVIPYPILEGMPDNNNPTDNNGNNNGDRTATTTTTTTGITIPNPDSLRIRRPDGETKGLLLLLHKGVVDGPLVPTCPFPLSIHPAHHPVVVGGGVAVCFPP